MELLNKPISEKERNLGFIVLRLVINIYLRIHLASSENSKKKTMYHALP